MVKSDGSIWFTDLDYGSAPSHEGERQMAGCHVYRFDPSAGTLRQMTDDFVMLNGLAFSPDATLLYIADTGSTHLADGQNHIGRFQVGHNDALSGGGVFATDPMKFFDGFRLDTAGGGAVAGLLPRRDGGGTADRIAPDYLIFRDPIILSTLIPFLLFRPAGLIPAVRSPVK